MSFVDTYPRLGRFLGPATFYLVFFSTIGYMLSTTIAFVEYPSV
jgi:hypothetical protein